MAKPKFYVQHFVACLNAAWEGTPGPAAPRTLEGVSHRLGVPTLAEPDFEFEELWLYTRLYRTNLGEGLRGFSVSLVWHDDPAGERVVFTRQLSPVRLSNAYPVASVAWPLRPVAFPGLGLYEFRLLAIGQRWAGPIERIVAREYLRIERVP